MERYFGEKTPKLGFGLMRLPKKDGEIDIPQVCEMVDLFMQAGMTYFDTAYVYDNGKSEMAAKAALVDRYPRESFTLATKLNAWLGSPDEAAAKQQIHTSLERTGAGYFDYYLLHALQENNYQIYDQLHLWDYMCELKEQGLVKHWGFSFHASPEMLDRLLTEHPDAEFVQLQLNYADWEDAEVASRRCHEVARAHGKSVVVMEPVKGGALAQPAEVVQKVLRAADPNASCASWAIRFAASLDGIITVLSGMSDLEQMRDNLSYMRDFKPLTSAEQETVRKAREALAQIDTIPCTACHYCTEGCPMNIPIPEIFAARNRQLLWNQTERGEQMYERAVSKGGRASDCIACGQCEGACPQRIDVITRLADCAQHFDK